MLLLFCGAAAIAQEKDDISYAELEQWSRSKNGFYQTYVSKGGHTYKKNDKLTFGPASEGKTYAYMWERLNALHVIGEVPTMPISGKMVGKTGIIKNIEVRGNKKTGHTVTVVVAVGASSRIEISPFEEALSSGEIVSSYMTKERAMKTLKEAKEMLDLGLITQAEFDAKKAELSKYILGK